ncbi:hypothetical protein CKF54_01995 [Psittacicella hinzii]|uniref:Uncharacterized protein n=1 Tax=Psittacicella hinzii TaxID=2028575 RepID=A0A3A1Y9L9_9GAMM|nr:hypothetical protein CKF54_01995 [Psittacicella hinzii]
MFIALLAVRFSEPVCAVRFELLIVIDELLETKSALLLAVKFDPAVWIPSLATRVRLPEVTVRFVLEILAVPAVAFTCSS